MKAFAMMLLATALTMTDTTSMPSQRRSKLRAQNRTAAMRLHELRGQDQQ
ncbi:hypothetical protein LMG19146_02572 [Xanthomonas arboricola pv. fragariae]|nr:hypothetical protein [Xanthomonas arboricola]SOU01571.1 hypothetical protein LMG19146_02572 [Xanthomonas arboricola pv. fragariae]